jgi:TolB protein
MSPDGTHLAYHVTGDRGGLSSWIVPAAGGAPVRLSPPNFSAGYPAWSRDGKRLALEVEDAGKTQIWLINRDGTGLRQLTSSAGQHWPHTWAPDGDRIAFAGERDGVWNVWTVSASTGECTQLTHFTSPNGYVRYPAWSPTNDRVVFEKSSDTSRIWTGRLKGVGGQ